MKKIRFFLATVIACTVLTASAQQVVGVSYAIDTTLSTAASLTIPGRKASGAGNFHVTVVHRVSGSTTLITGDTTSYQSSAVNVSGTAKGLSAQTDYELALIFYNANYTDSVITGFKPGRTLATPQQATAWVTQVIPGIPYSSIIYSYSAIGANWRSMGQMYPGYNSVTDTGIVTGVGTDTLRLASAPNQAFAKGVIYLEPINPVPGIYPTTSFNEWQPFTAPGYTKSKIVSLDTVLTWVDSVAIRSVDSIGNGGPMISSIDFIDPNGTVLQSWNKTQAASGTFSVSRSSLVPNTTYTVKQKGFTGGVFQDSATLVVKTRQVPAPSGTISGISYGKTSTSFFVNWNSKGTWATSAIDTISVYEDGVLVAAYPKFLTGTGIQTVSRTGLSAGTAHVYQVYIRNLAGLQVLLSTTITTDPYISEPAPQWGNPVGNDATTVKLSNVYVTVTQGDVAELMVRFRRNQDPSYGSPQVAAGSLQSSGTISPIVSGLQFGTQYWFQIGTRSEDGITTWNAQEKYAITPNAGNPLVEDIVLNAPAGSTLSGTLFCNGQGMLAQAKTEVYSLGSGTPAFLQGNAWNTGSTGAFTRFFSFMNVPVGVLLEIRGYASEVPTNNITEMSKFVTITPTGIEKIEPEEALKQVIGCAWDLQGRLLGTGYLDDLRSVRYGQVVVIGYREERYKKLHPTEKIFVQ